MWLGELGSVTLTSGFSFLGGASLGLLGVAEASAPFVSAGSGFQDFEFSGRRQPCLICAGLGVCLRGDTTLPGTDSLGGSMAHIAHPFSECQQMDAIKPRRCSLAGHRSRVWEGWPLCRAYGLVFTADSCNWEEERIMGAPNFPVSRQRREHGRTPRAHETKSQKKKRKGKEKRKHYTSIGRIQISM